MDLDALVPAERAQDLAHVLAILVVDYLSPILKCIICKKELPEGTKVPACEHHRTQAKEKEALGATGVATTAIAVAKPAPKAIPVVKEKAPVIAKAAAI